MGRNREIATTDRTVLADADYIAPDGLWLSVQGTSIRILPGPRGITISVYAEGREMEQSYLDAWVDFSELENMVNV